jgi:hypothetical protein
VFKSFLPKICAIPASVVPISILSSVGYIAPEYQVPQVQPDTCVLYLRVVFCVVPLTFALLSFYLKTFFIMKTRQQVAKIGTGIGRHLIGLPSVCPFSDATITVHRYSAGETHIVGVIGHFTGVGVIEGLLEEGGAAKLLHTSEQQLKIASVSIIALFAGACLTVWYLIASDISFIPVLVIVCVGVNTVALIFAIFRRAAATEMQRAVEEGTLTPALLHKVLLQRKMLASTHVHTEDAKPRWTPSRKHVKIVVGTLLLLVLIMGFFDRGGRRCHDAAESGDPDADCRTGGFVMGLTVLGSLIAAVAICIARKKGYCLHLDHPCEHIEVAEHDAVEWERAMHGSDCQRSTRSAPNPMFDSTPKTGKKTGQSVDSAASGDDGDGEERLTLSNQNAQAV